MNNTTKVFVVFGIAAFAVSAGILLGKKLERSSNSLVVATPVPVDMAKLSACLEPYSGKVQVKDKDGKSEEVTVVVANAIPACLK